MFPLQFHYSHSFSLFKHPPFGVRGAVCRTDTRKKVLFSAEIGLKLYKSLSQFDVGLSQLNLVAAWFLRLKSDCKQIQAKSNRLISGATLWLKDKKKNSRFYFKKEICCKIEFVPRLFTYFVSCFVLKCYQALRKSVRKKAAKSFK